MDIFAQIAKSGIQGRRNALVNHPLAQRPEKITPLQPCQQEPTPLPEEMRTPEQLQHALQQARAQFASFLQDHAPALTGLRTILPLTNFSWRKKGDTKEQPVTLPHYGGPLGKATTFYNTTFAIQKPHDNKRTYIVIAGADYVAKVFVNGEFVGMHEGFFATFEFDITDVIVNGENELIIQLENDYIMHGSETEDNKTRVFGDKIYAATGPGYDDPAVGWHHCPPAMGLFESVTIEQRAPVHINTAFARTLDDEMEFWIEAGSALYAPQNISFRLSLHGKNHKQTVFTNLHYVPSTGKELGLGDTFTEVLSRRDGTLNASLPLPCYKGRNQYKIRSSAQDLKWWTPDAPYLYELQIELLTENGSVLDTHCYTFGRRTFTQDNDSSPKGMFYLNGTPFRLRGANTMGFEQQDVMRGDDDQLIDDILLARLCNLNFWRLTQRPVQQKIYDFCDRLGLLIQTDLPMFGCLRRQQFCEALRQTEEMVRHVRGHACCVLITYINEPFPNAFNQPQMSLERTELESFFDAADIIVHMHNPDCVIKHVDGDYDPPSTTLPDNHCYPMWYNGHGIDIGMLHKGHWIPVAPDWYYGCGEYGCEGLENWELMKKAYPASWLPKPGAPLSEWSPSQIGGAQSGDFYHFFYDRPDTPEQWVAESQRFQALATRMMTEAFRRDNRMVTFAIHLFIDAFPSGWMKTIMDCERNPKPAFFEYQKALSPLLVSLRSDKQVFFGGETAEVEGWLCNDTQSSGEATFRYELLQNGKVIASTEMAADLVANHAKCDNRISFTVPTVQERTVLELRGILLQGGTCIASNSLPLTVLPACPQPTAVTVRKAKEITAQDLEAAQNGAVLWVDKPEPGNYTIGDYCFTVRESGMAPMHFASAKTGHAWVQGICPDDLRHWYSRQTDRITALADATIDAPEEFVTVLKSRNINPQDGKWHEVPLLCEASYGNGRIIFSAISHAQMLDNPAGQIILSRI